VEKRYTKFESKWAEAYSTQHCKTGGQPSLKSLLQQGLTILVAPHHGLESCYSPTLFEAMKGGRPKLVVISERRKTNEKDGTTHANYQQQQCSSGLKVEVDGSEDFRLSLTTKGGHHILAVLGNTGGTRVFADTDPNKLLAKL